MYKLTCNLILERNLFIGGTNILVPILEGAVQSSQAEEKKQLTRKSVRVRGCKQKTKCSKTDITYPSLPPVTPLLARHNPRIILSTEEISPAYKFSLA